MPEVHAQPSPELGLDLVGDVRRLPRWDPRYWGHVGVGDEPRSTRTFLKLGLAWAARFAKQHARASGLALARCDGLANLLEHAGELALNALSGDAEDAKAERLNGSVTPGISDSAAGVIAAINFNDEPSGWRTEISDEVADDELAPEANAELTRANGLPEALLGMGERRAHAGCASCEQLVASGTELRFFQESLLVPVKWPGAAPFGAGCVTRAAVSGRIPRSRGTQRAPLREARPLHRDEVRGKQLSTSVPRCVRPPGTPLDRAELLDRSESTCQLPLHSAGASTRRDDLPHSRAARAGAFRPLERTAAPHAGACEHEFGEGRAPAGGSAAEDARVGAAPEDLRVPEEWPAGAKPVTRKVDYDDLYRATKVSYEYSTGDDTWISPDAPDLAGPTDLRRAQPMPHVTFTTRPRWQSYQYDWLGTISNSDDDQHASYDRSLGPVTTNAATGKPYQLASAAQPVSGANITGTNARAGTVSALYDRAGFATQINLTRATTVPCVPASACGYRVDLSFDEVGRLQWAKRWNGSAYALSLYYQYDASDERVSKVSVDNVGNTRDTEYVFGSLELHRTTYNTTTGVYGLKDASNANLIYEVPYLEAHGVRLARLAYDSTAGPDQPHFATAGSGRLHVFFELGDHLGSTSAVLDQATGELVELGTYQPYGATESDYRPDRWKGFREDYRFTGKEEDIEVGLEYFGKRYLSPYLGEWVSADPLAVHAPGQADLNLYAYVSGHILIFIDAVGMEETASAPPPPSRADFPCRTDETAEENEQAYQGALFYWRAQNENTSSKVGQWDGVYHEDKTQQLYENVGASGSNPISALANLTGDPDGPVKMLPVVGVLFSVGAAGDRVSDRGPQAPPRAELQPATKAQYEKTISKELDKLESKIVSALKPVESNEGASTFTDPKERAVADYLESLGRQVSKNPMEGVAGARRQGDAFVDGVLHEFKSLDPGAGPGTIKNVVNNSIRRGGQAREIVIDARGTGLGEAEAKQGAAKAFGISRGKVDGLTILGDDYFFRWSPKPK